jgi:hypothetical protein
MTSMITAESREQQDAASAEGISSMVPGRGGKCRHSHGAGTAAGTHKVKEAPAPGSLVQVNRPFMA